jgi:hypothetical protein
MPLWPPIQSLVGRLSANRAIREIDWISNSRQVYRPIHSRVVYLEVVINSRVKKLTNQIVYSPANRGTTCVSSNRQQIKKRPRVLSALNYANVSIPCTNHGFGEEDIYIFATTDYSAPRPFCAGYGFGVHIT